MAPTTFAPTFSISDAEHVKPEPHTVPGFKDSHTSPIVKMDALETGLRGLSSEKSARSSFSSVRENDSELAQTFTSTKVSSYSRLAEDAVEDLPPPSPDMATMTKQFRAPLTQPQSRLHGHWLPAVAADGFQGWKQIDVRGRQASRSFGDLQALKIVWSTPPTPTKTKRPGRPAPGQAAIERLPLELLGEFSNITYGFVFVLTSQFRSHHRSLGRGCPT